MNYQNGYSFEQKTDNYEIGWVILKTSKYMPKDNMNILCLLIKVYIIVKFIIIQK